MLGKLSSTRRGVAANFLKPPHQLRSERAGDEGADIFLCLLFTFLLRWCFWGKDHGINQIDDPIRTGERADDVDLFVDHDGWLLKKDIEHKSIHSFV